MRDKVTLYITLLIGIFIIISMVGNFVLLITGAIEPEDSDVWRPLFDLVAILVGSVAGYIGGVEVEKNRKRKAAMVSHEIPERDHYLDGWREGIKQAHLALQQEGTVEGARVRLEALMIADYRYKRKGRARRQSGVA